MASHQGVNQNMMFGLPIMERIRASGGPGIEPRWTSSSKDGVGTSLSGHSKVWFTVSHGIVNEIYYPRIDTANLRDHQFLVSDKGFFSEERRDTFHKTEMIDENTPAFKITNTCKSGNYSIEKIVFTDPDSDVLIESVTFKNLKKLNLKVYSLLAPHINNSGYGNSAWVGDYKGHTMVFAKKDSIFMASCFNIKCRKISCGYSGINDGWQDIRKNGEMTFNFSECDDGNIAITSELEIPQNGKFDFYIGYGTSPEEAALKVLVSMESDSQSILQKYGNEWKDYMESLKIDEKLSKKFRLYKRSIIVLKCHQAKGQFPGAIIASLSIPWGNTKGDNDIGGYHLIWPRDMVEAAESLLIAGDRDGALSAFKFLMATQEGDGHWFQNLWLDGKSYWNGIQMDETAFPIILAYRLFSQGIIGKSDALITMLRKAVRYIILNGPATDQDRWEEDGGITPFTISVEITGLVCAGKLFEAFGLKREANLAVSFADYINSRIDGSLYVMNTNISNKSSVEGYYMRITGRNSTHSSNGSEPVSIKNRPVEHSQFTAADLICVDAPAMVRFGIRSAKDVKIMNTIKVIDDTLLTQTRSGPVWHRYNHDGYGEHPDGSAFDGTGIGRGWPLLVGERGHYEIANGNFEEAQKLLSSMEKMTSPGGLIPEQIWDSDDIPKRGLFNGKPSGSAMPLVWAHGEYIKLCHSIMDGKISDQLDFVYNRYVGSKVEAHINYWNMRYRTGRIKKGDVLRIVLGEAAKIHFTFDQWVSAKDVEVSQFDTNLFFSDFETESEKSSVSFIFTIFWENGKKWQGENFTIVLE